MPRRRSPPVPVGHHDEVLAARERHRRRAGRAEPVPAVLVRRGRRPRWPARAPEQPALPGVTAERDQLLGLVDAARRPPRRPAGRACAPRPSTSCTSTASWAPVVTLLIRERSILTEASGRLRSSVREEWPVPKSSSAKWTPRSRTLRSVAAASGTSVTIAVSVTSSTSRSGRARCPRAPRVTSSTKDGSRSCTGETFTDIDQGGSGGLRPGHGLAARSREHPAAELHDQVRRLGQRDEHVRWDDAELRVGPAGQGLHAGGGPVGEVHDGW